MSKLEKLIKEYCPDGVEYISVEILIKDKMVKTITPSIKIKRNDYKESGSTPIISQEMEYISGYCDLVDNNIPQDYYVCFGDHSEHIKYIDFAFVQGADGLKIMSTDNKALNARYFYHAISAFYVRHDNYERHFKYLTDTTIPVPPLPVQSEIVRILDNFTELTAELTARKKQYEYYRERLLNVSAPMVKVLDVVEKCNNIKWQDNDVKQYIDLTSVNRENSKIENTTTITKADHPSRAQQIVHAGDILFGTTRPLLKRQTYITNEYDNQICSTGYCILRVRKDAIHPKWLYYQIQTERFYRHVESLQIEGSYPSITDDNVKKFSIPAPSMSEQERIVSILDRFDTLCNGISDGLPAEIEARQKQYEYYRDKLLSFNELA